MKEYGVFIVGAGVSRLYSNFKSEITFGMVLKVLDIKLVSRIVRMFGGKLR